MDEINNKINLKKVISWILVILWMITVFCFSSQVGDESKATSGNTIRRIVLFFNTNISEYKLEEIVELLQPFTRKLAHFTIYTIGGFILYNLNNKYDNSKKRKIAFSFLLGLMYAITDEIHQYFVPGRSCRIFDVFVDSCGVITGILLYISMLKIIDKILKNKVKKVNK